MIDRDHDLPLTRQAEVLGLSRSSLYYLPLLVSADDLAIMGRIDKLHLEFPFAGSRMLRDFLRAEGFEIGGSHAATLMRRMGVEALYRRANPSKPAPGHKIHPYLLRGLKIERPNQVWAMDITGISMARGFVYLAAVIDWSSRRVGGCRSSWRWISAWKQVEEALAKYGKPEIFNTDQGSQFTSAAFTGLLRDNGIVERLWRSVKDEEVYLKAYDSVSNARTLIGRYLRLLQRQAAAFEPGKPDQACFDNPPMAAAA